MGTKPIAFSYFNSQYPSTSLNIIFHNGHFKSSAGFKMPNLFFIRRHIFQFIFL